MLKPGSLAYATYGFSPILNFELSQGEDIQELIQKATSGYHCQLDGDVVEDTYLKIACLRMEEGQTVSLTQVMLEHEAEVEYEKFIKEEGGSRYDKESQLDAKQQELRKLFESIKL